MSKNIVSMLSMVVWVSVLTVAIITVNTRWINPPKRLVTVDIISLVKEKVVQTANSTTGKKSKANRKSVVNKVNRDIEWALKELARQNKVIIVPKQAVLAGQAEDVTDVIRQALGLNKKNSTIKFTLTEK